MESDSSDYVLILIYIKRTKDTIGMFHALYCSVQCASLYRYYGAGSDGVHEFGILIMTSPKKAENRHLKM
jgi:hypothetical protein